MSWQTLRPQIKTLLDTATNLYEVSSSPKLNFGGWPSAYIVPSPLESDYETTNENQRVYAYQVVILQETKNKGMSDAITALETAADEVLDLIDDEDQKGADTRTVGVSLPAGKLFLRIEAVNAGWAEIEGNQLLMVELSVRVHISVDVS